MPNGQIHEINVEQIISIDGVEFRPQGDQVLEILNALNVALESIDSRLEALETLLPSPEEKPNVS